MPSSNRPRALASACRLRRQHQRQLCALRSQLQATVKQRLHPRLMTDADHRALWQLAPQHGHQQSSPAFRPAGRVWASPLYQIRALTAPDFFSRLATLLPDNPAAAIDAAAIGKLERLYEVSDRESLKEIATLANEVITRRRKARKR